MDEQAYIIDGIDITDEQKILLLVALGDYEIEQYDENKIYELVGYIEDDMFLSSSEKEIISKTIFGEDIMEAYSNRKREEFWDSIMQ